MADNMVTLVGALGGEPELRTTQQGTDVANFRMATNERVRNGEGKWVDGPTSWFRVTAWSALGRNVHASLHKGQRVVVHGVLRITEFTTENGQTSRQAEVRALAVGPELAFGTTTFTRSGVAALPTSPSAPPAGERTEPVPAGWSTALGAEDETPF